MGEPRNWDVRCIEVEDPANDRAERLTALLAAGVEHWLRQRRSVDSGGDLSVYPDVEAGQSPW